MNGDISYAAASKDFKAGRYLESLTRLNQLMDIQKDARTFALLAKTLLKLGMREEAATAYGLAADLNSSQSDEYREMALLLHFECGHDDLTLAAGSKLVSRARKNPALAYALASILVKRNDYEHASAFKKVLASSDEPAHMILASRMLMAHWDSDSAEHIETAHILMRKIPHNNTMRLIYLTLCRDISRYEAIEKQQKPIFDALARGEDDFLVTDHPFFNLHWTGDERLNSLVRLNTIVMPEGTRARRQAMPHNWSDKKLRIGYVSADLWDQHATMKLIRRVFELHDRDRFEITLFCNTPQFLLDRNTADRSQWGNVVRIEGMSDDEICDLIRAHEIDVLVDMKGYTKYNRASIFNQPCAPVHVSWLGFPGSTYGIDLDYIIGDHFVLRDSSAPWYPEKFCRLPECYQPNDPYYRPVPEPIERSQIGLPEDAFVFASFNGNRKITLEMTEIWAEILKRTPNSVLWIMRANMESQNNIIGRFQKLGIPAKRLYFMKLEQYQDHINRIPLADLGLDTYPVNGHTTTSEQLWAGLPVLTVKGTNFASRVSESLLTNMGVPDLITQDREDYIRRAVELYENRGDLAAYRQRILDGRFTQPLFDAERFTRHLEKSFEMMAERARQGLQPDHMDVPALPPRNEPFMKIEDLSREQYRVL